MLSRLDNQDSCSGFDSTAALLRDILSILRGILQLLRKSLPASFSRRSETRRTEAYASPLRSLRPCWTDFLSILFGILLLQSSFRESMSLKMAHKTPAT